MNGLQNGFRILRQPGKSAAFDRLHDDDLPAVLPDHLIAGPGLHQLAVPVDGVERDLNKLDLWMLCQNAVQQLRGGMERDAQMTDLPVFLPFFCVVKEVCRLDNAALAVIAVIVDVLNCVDLQSSRHFPDSL